MITKKEVEALVTEAGMTVVEIKRCRHWRATVQRADGSVTKVSFPVSPSDHRALKNKRSELRHIARG